MRFYILTTIITLGLIGCQHGNNFALMSGFQSSNIMSRKIAAVEEAASLSGQQISGKVYKCEARYKRDPGFFERIYNNKPTLTEAYELKENKLYLNGENIGEISNSNESEIYVNLHDADRKMKLQVDNRSSGRNLYVYIEGYPEEGEGAYHFACVPKPTKHMGRINLIFAGWEIITD